MRSAARRHSLAFAAGDVNAHTETDDQFDGVDGTRTLIGCGSIALGGTLKTSGAVLHGSVTNHSERAARQMRLGITHATASVNAALPEVWGELVRTNGHGGSLEEITVPTSRKDWPQHIRGRSAPRSGVRSDRRRLIHVKQPSAERTSAEPPLRCGIRLGGYIAVT